MPAENYANTWFGENICTEEDKNSQVWQCTELDNIHPACEMVGEGCQTYHIASKGYPEPNMYKPWWSPIPVHHEQNPIDYSGHLYFTFNGENVGMLCDALNDQKSILANKQLQGVTTAGKLKLIIACENGYFYLKGFSFFTFVQCYKLLF